MERNSKGIAVTVAIVTVVGVSLLALLAVVNRRDQTVGLNQEIEHDDFAFSVQDVRKTNSVGNGEYRTKSKGIFYIVTLKISNNAKRVDYNFRNSSARLADVEEREFRVSAEGQQGLESTNGKKCDGPIRAGASCIAEVVFDLPEESELKQFRISSGGLVVDILEVIFFGRKRIELSSIQ